MKRHMIYGILAIIAALILAMTLAFLLVSKRSEGLPEAWATIGTGRLRIEIAASALARARGLSYRDELAEGRGMLFTFGSAQRRSFWMKGMRFPIDIIWLRDSAVVDITKNIDPQIGASMMQLKLYAPLLPADDVLEVPAGYADAHNITVGSRLVLRDK